MARRSIFICREAGKVPYPSGHRALTTTRGPSNGGVVLVVEDDPGVRELTVSRLKAIGYKVVEAVDGRKAAEVLKSAEPVDLVFTDLVMPGGISGHDVAALARKLRPGIRILLTSGYAEDLVPVDPELAQLKILRKPYRQGDLVAALREVLPLRP